MAAKRSKSPSKRSKSPKPPPTPKATWDAVKADYIAGMPLDEITTKHGVSRNALTARRTRKGWNMLKVRVHHEAKKREEIALTDLNQRVRGALGEDINQSVDALCQIKVDKTVKGIGQRADVLGSLVSVASKVFSWDKDDKTPTNSINIALLTPNQSQPAPEQLADFEVIDVEERIRKQVKG